jgi:hypothetical protein
MKLLNGWLKKGETFELACGQFSGTDLILHRLQRTGSGYASGDYSWFRRGRGGMDVVGTDVLVTLMDDALMDDV